MSLDTYTFLPGEPIVLHYKITDFSDQDLMPDIRDGKNQCLEEGGKSWVSLTLTDTVGKTAPSVSLLPPAFGMAHSTGPRIPVGTSYVGALVVNQWVIADHSGSYVLLVHVRLPCTFGQGETQSWFLLTKDFSFPLVITPADTNRLRMKASALRMGGMADTDFKGQALKFESLFVLPEQTALPEWQALVADESLTGTSRARAAEEIAKINSLAAVDLMAQLCWGPRPLEEKPTDATEMLCLSNMWIFGSAAMKAHIEELAAAHGEKMPFRPLVRLD